jgi:hypothetical protein
MPDEDDYDYCEIKYVLSNGASVSYEDVDYYWEWDDEAEDDYKVYYYYDASGVKQTFYDKDIAAYSVDGATYTTYTDASTAKSKVHNEKCRYNYYTALVEYYNSRTDNSASYSIRAYKGSNLSTDSITATTSPVLGVSASVTAKATTNGIQVSWSPIDGANYYQVYRVEAGALVKNATTGVYTLNSYATSNLVYDYEGYTALEQVATTDGSVRYYKNYSYKTSYITGTSVVDISGTISDGNLQYVEETSRTSTRDYDRTTYTSTYTYSRQNTGSWVDKGAKKGSLYTTGLEAGVEYQYYVVGYYDPSLTDKNYRSGNVYDLTRNPNNYLYQYDVAGNPIRYYGYDAVNCAYTYDPTKNTYTYSQDTVTKNYAYTYYYGYYDTATHTIAYSATPIYLHSVNESDVSSYIRGAKKITSATFTGVKTPAKATIKSVKASGTKATITYKKVTGATGYKIYRSTKKKSGYELVGTITKGSTLKFVDKGLTKGKTYYYKVVAVTANEAGAEIEGKASAVKSVKIKAATKKK